MGGKCDVEKRLKDQPVVVIIGGGYGGCTVAKMLDEHVNVLLVERKSMFYHNIAALRASVEGDTNRVLIPYTNLLKFGHVVQAEVTSIDVQQKTIRLHGYEPPVSFDYLVIATGTSYSFPMKVAATETKELQQSIKQFASSCKAAQHVLIVGGGAVGCELAGELRHVHPQALITLVHVRSDLIGGTTTPAFRAEVKKRLEGLKVNVILDEKLIIPDDAHIEPRDSHAPESDDEPSPGLRYIIGQRAYSTQKGKRLEADMVVFATGALVNSNAYAGTAGITLSAGKHILVDEFLRAKGQTHVFALGDCAEVEAKLAYAAGLQAKALAANILATIAGKPLKPYKKLSTNMMLLPMGPNEGCTMMGNMVVGKTITGAIKGKDLFTSKYRTEMGVKSATDLTELPEIDPVKLAARLHIPEQEAKELISSAQPVKHGPEATHV